MRLRTHRSVSSHPDSHRTHCAYGRMESSSIYAFDIPLPGSCTHVAALRSKHLFLQCQCGATSSHRRGPATSVGIPNEIMRSLQIWRTVLVHEPRRERQTQGGAGVGCPVVRLRWGALGYLCASLRRKFNCQALFRVAHSVEIRRINRLTVIIISIHNPHILHTHYTHIISTNIRASPRLEFTEGLEVVALFPCLTDLLQLGLAAKLMFTALSTRCCAATLLRLPSFSVLICLEILVLLLFIVGME